MLRELPQKLVVIKYGGAAMASGGLQQDFAEDLAMLKIHGLMPVVVHGGGPEISSWCKKSGIEPQFIDGLRVTDAQTMEIAQMLLVGKINRSIVSLLNQNGVKAAGLSGHDGDMIRATKHWHHSESTPTPVDLGFVGDVAHINTDAIMTLVGRGFVPVIAPIGVDASGQSYNINADTVAGEIAAALKSKTLVFLTDVEGVRADKNNPKSVLRHLGQTQAKNWLASKQLEGGMIPKIEASVKALESGTSDIFIADGRVPHNLVHEIILHKGIGTLMQGNEI